MLQALRSKKLVLVVVAAVLLFVVINTNSKDQNAAPTAKAAASALSGPAPLAVDFNSNESSDPDKDALTFDWNFGDGTTSTDANPSKTFDKSGEYTVVLKVSDKKHTTEATPVVIKVGAAAVQGTSTGTGYTLGTSTKPAAKKKATITTVTAPLASKPVATFGADKTVITAGENVVLSWSVAGTAPLCTASGAWSGSVAVNGTQTVSPATTSTYTLTCANGAGADVKSVTITVNSPVVVDPNLIKNSSFAEPYSSEIPRYWVAGSYGTNNAVFGYEALGRTDDTSASITMTEYVYGDAKWIFDAVDIIGGNTYEFKDWYKATVETEILVDYTLADNSHEYVLLAPVAAATDWTELSRMLATPVNAVKVSVHHMIKANGTLNVDDYSLVAQ